MFLSKKSNNLSQLEQSSGPIYPITLINNGILFPVL